MRTTIEQEGRGEASVRNGGSGMGRPLTLRRPRIEDGKAMHRLVERVEQLEANSGYSYLMLCHYFADTCVVAVDEDGDLAGFVTGFRPPSQPDAFFVWQITVAPEHRGQGLARRMLEHLLRRHADRGVRYLEATVTPSNTASQRTFRSMARRLGALCCERILFDKSHFGDDEDHEPEILFRIGPFAPERVLVETNDSPHAVPARK